MNSDEDRGERTRRSGDRRSGMRLADDRRARVPFALLGALLLLTSAGLAATLATPPAGQRDASAAVATEQAQAAVHTVLREATLAAARDAARNPVVVRANTTYGRVLDRSSPFRDALRIRIYRQVRRSLAASDQTVRGVRANVTLPPVTNASTLRAAKQRVGVERVGNASLRVTLRDISLTVNRGGTTVYDRTLTVRTTVFTPVLVLHNRTERFEADLNAGDVSRPGFGRQFTAILYSFAWSRGYAMYGGANVSNVLANRHVELAANKAALAAQRDAFGRSDRAGRTAFYRGLVRAGILDMVLPRVGRTGFATSVLDGAIEGPNANTSPPVSVSPFPGNNTTVAVNDTAGSAYYQLIQGNHGPSLDEVVRSVYSARVRRAVATTRTNATALPAPSSPGPGWRLLGNHTSTNRTVVGSVNGSGTPTATIGPTDHRLFTERRRVRTEITAVRTWERVNWSSNGSRTTAGTANGSGVTTPAPGPPGAPPRRTTTARAVQHHRVVVTVAGTHAESNYAPRRPITTVHRQGGPLGGPNLRNVSRKARTKLITDAGGVDAIARGVVAGRIGDDAATVVGDRPPGLRTWIGRDLRTIRKRVRNVSASVGSAGLIHDVNPADVLSDRVRSRRGGLAPVPSRYGSVAEKARVAAEQAYVDRVQGALARQRRSIDSTQGRLDGTLQRLTGYSASAVTGLARSLDSIHQPPPKPVRTDALGSVNLSVDGSPAYLTLSSVDSTRVRTLDGPSHPLAARNVNVFTVPYGDAADGIVSVFFPSQGQVPLDSAARSLASANRLVGATGNATLRARRDRLRGKVRASLQTVRGQAVQGLTDEGMNRSPARQAVGRAFARWPTPAARALAVTNGSMARTVAAVASSHPDTPNGTLWRDAVRFGVRDRMRGASVRAASVPQGSVNDTVSSVKSVARREVTRGLEAVAQNASQRLHERMKDELENATRNLSERLKGRTPFAVPAGLMVTPVPSSWYATVNVWSVEARGTYGRFVVRAPRVDARTGAGGQPLTYVRDGQAVALDVDGDGSEERLGYSTRVGFRVETAVVVVVPPGKNGVGDLDGQMFEDSGGWPSPTPVVAPSALAGTTGVPSGLVNRTANGTAVVNGTVGWVGANGSSEDCGDAEVYPGECRESRRRPGALAGGLPPGP